MLSADRWYDSRARILPLVNLIAFSFVIIMNVLASLKVINGKDSADVSNKYFTRFTPAGWTFSIWGLIYGALSTFLIGHVVQGLIKGRDNEIYNGKINFLFAINCFFNGIWLILWHFEMMWASAITLTLGILFPLIAIYYRVGINYGNAGRNRTVEKEAWREGRTASYRSEERTVQRWEIMLVYVPFSLYLGWVCVATIANWTCAVVSLNDDSSVKPEDFSVMLSHQAWSAILQTASTILSVGLFMAYRKDCVQPLVQMWALLGIWSRQRTVPNSKLVVVASWINISITFASWLILCAYLIREYRKEQLEFKAQKESRTVDHYLTSEP